MVYDSLAKGLRNLTSIMGFHSNDIMRLGDSVVPIQMQPDLGQLFARPEGETDHDVESYTQLYCCSA